MPIHGKTVYVKKSGSSWQIRLGRRLVGSKTSKDEAMRLAKSIAESHNTKVEIH